MPGESARINGRKGGRPISTATKLAQAMRERLTERVHKELDPVIDAQIGLAKGIQVMMVREWETDKRGEQHRTGRWVQVTDPSELEELLNGEQAGDEYYQIWTKTPDVAASKNLMDQTIGKAKETVDMDLKSGGISLSELFKQAIKK